MQLGTVSTESTNRNARVAHIRKFVCKPPDRGETLRLVTIEASPTVLGEWLKVACVDNSQTPEDVDALLRDHANTVDDEISANLVWQTADGLVCCSKRLKCRPDKPHDVVDPAAIAQQEALGINGTERGILIQYQREREAHMRSYFGAHQVQINQYASLVQTLGAMANESLQIAHRTQIEIDKMRAAQRREIDAYAEEARNAISPESEESSARTEVIRMVNDAFKVALPYIVQAIGNALTQPPAAPAQPAATPTAEAAE